VDALTTRGRLLRLAITLIGAAALLSGSIWGSDDHFPFGPFRMFAGVNGPNEDAPDPRVDAVDVAGNVVALNEQNTGIRRAEIEDQQDRFVEDPSRLRQIADTYAARNPAAARLVEVRLVMRWHEIRNSRATGRFRDEILATWRAP